MAHIDRLPTVLLIVEGDACGDPCGCWDTSNRGQYGEIYPEGGGDQVASIVVAAINAAITDGRLPPEVQS